MLVVAAWGSLSAWAVEAWVDSWPGGAAELDAVVDQACCVLVVAAGSCPLLSCGDPCTSCYLSYVDYDCSTTRQADAETSRGDVILQPVTHEQVLESRESNLPFTDQFQTSAIKNH